MQVLTRYLSVLYLARFGFLLVTITAFILSLDLVTNAEKIVDRSGGETTAVAKYAALKLPQIISDTIKFSSLFAALLTLISLMRHNQMAPIWDGGISQFGVIRRFAPVALVIGVFQFCLDDMLVPAANAELREWAVVEQEPFEKKNPHAAIGATWIKVGNDILRIPQGNEQNASLGDIVIFQRNVNGGLVGRLDVSSARLGSDGWDLEGVTRRTVNGTFDSIERLEGWGASFRPKNLLELKSHPRDLAFHRLFGFVSAEAQGTWAPHLYETWLQVKIAVCFVPLLMIFLIVALSQRFQRTGRTEFLFLVGLALGFAFFIFNGIGLALGEVGLLPPIIAGWAATVGFAAITGAIAFSREVHDTSARDSQADVP